MIDVRESTDKIKKYYDTLFDKHGESISSLGWSREGQQIRFQEIYKFLPQNTKTILDVGCGFGDFSKFLHNKKHAVHYTGWDLNETFISHCVQKPNSIFDVRNILQTPPADNSYDVCLTVGSLNTEFGNNDEIARSMLTALFNASKEATFFSATSEYVDNEYRDLSGKMHYYSPEKMFTYAKSLTKKVSLIHSYLPHDFLLVLYK